MRYTAGAFKEVVRHLESLHEYLLLNFNLRMHAVPFFPVRGTLLGLLRYGRVYGALPEGLDFIDERAQNRFEFALVLPQMEDRFPAAVALTTVMVEDGWQECWLRSQGDLPFRWAGQVESLVCARDHPSHEVSFDFLTSEGASETRERGASACCR